MPATATFIPYNIVGTHVRIHNLEGTLREWHPYGQMRTYALHTTLMDSKSTSVSSISTNDKATIRVQVSEAKESNTINLEGISRWHSQLRYLLRLEKIQGFLQIKPSSGRAKNRASLMVDILNKFGSQFDWAVGRVIKPTISS